MDEYKLLQIALSFREAIQQVRLKYGFYNNSDRMNNFPRGCCDDSADLIGYYLRTEHNILSVQRKGTYRDNVPDNITDHVWTELEDGTIIDITADQFPDLIESIKGVYIGCNSDFYSGLEGIVTYQHYNIIDDLRLWHDYQAICEHINE